MWRCHVFPEPRHSCRRSLNALLEHNGLWLEHESVRGRFMLNLLPLRLTAEIVCEVFHILSVTLLLIVQDRRCLGSLPVHSRLRKRQKLVLHKAVNLLQMERAGLSGVNFSVMAKQDQQVVDA